MRHDEQSVEMIYDAIDEANEAREPGQLIPRSPETILMGESSPLDSLSFVTLLASVEARVEERFDQRISLIEVVAADDAAGSFTVADLAQSIADLLQPVPPR